MNRPLPGRLFPGPLPGGQKDMKDMKDMKPRQIYWVIHGTDLGPGRPPGRPDAPPVPPDMVLESLFVGESSKFPSESSNLQTRTANGCQHPFVITRKKHDKPTNEILSGGESAYTKPKNQIRERK